MTWRNLVRQYWTMLLWLASYHRIMMVLMPEMYRHDEGYRIAVTKAKTSYLDFKDV